MAAEAFVEMTTLAARENMAVRGMAKRCVIKVPCVKLTSTVLIFGVAAIGRNCLCQATSDSTNLSWFDDNDRKKLSVSAVSRIRGEIYGVCAARDAAFYLS